MGRYTLKVNVNGFGIFTVRVPEEGILKEKVSLMAVDSFTIGKNPRVLLKSLDFNEALLIGKNKFYISYISNGCEKRLEVIFKDVHGLKQLALNGDRKISTFNPKINNFIDKVFLPLMLDPKFKNFLKTNGLLTYKLEEWVEYYLSGNYNLDFCYSKILEYASNYKQFRALVIGCELYKNSNFLKIEEKPNYENFVLSHLDEDIDPDKDFGLYSEEELNDYAEYLESLPDSFDSHEKRR